MKRKPGQFIKVRGSGFLGTPPCLGRICRATADGWEVMEAFKPDGSPNSRSAETFDIDDAGYVLVGPPLRGHLVRAP